MVEVSNYDTPDVSQRLNFVSEFLHVLLEKLDGVKIRLPFQHGDRLSIPGAIVVDLLPLDVLLVDLPVILHMLAQVKRLLLLRD